MLKIYMETQEYEGMIMAAVTAEANYKAEEKRFLDALDRLELDSNTYDSIDDPATLMMCAARDAAYKKGFQDGMKQTAECMSAGSSVNCQSDFSLADLLRTGMDTEFFDGVVYGRAENSDEFKEARKVFDDCFDVLEEKNPDLYGKIDESLGTMLYNMADAALDVGFKLGVKMIISCFSDKGIDVSSFRRGAAK